MWVLNYSVFKKKNMLIKEAETTMDCLPEACCQHALGFCDTTYMTMEFMYTEHPYVHFNK